MLTHARNQIFDRSREKITFAVRFITAFYFVQFSNTEKVEYYRLTKQLLCSDRVSLAQTVNEFRSNYFMKILYRLNSTNTISAVCF